MTGFQGTSLRAGASPVRPGRPGDTDRPSYRPEGRHQCGNHLSSAPPPFRDRCGPGSSLEVAVPSRHQGQSSDLSYEEQCRLSREPAVSRKPPPSGRSVCGGNYPGVTRVSPAHDLHWYPRPQVGGNGVSGDMGGPGHTCHTNLRGIQCKPGQTCCAITRAAGPRR